MKKSVLPILIAGAAFLNAARADEIQFTTLPQPVQTTVIRETHLQSPSGVVRIIHDSSGVYAVTVRGDAGDQVVYVNDSGAIVQAPATGVQAQQGTTTTTTVQTAQPAVTTQQTVVTYDQIQKDQPRYELVEKKGKKEIYIDHQTGQKVTVKREDK